MAALQKRLALDTNVPLDLADKKDFAHDFRETFLKRGYALLIPPTVVIELTLLATGAEGGKQELAMNALQHLREWGIHPYDLKSVGHGITEKFAGRLIQKGLLPEGEFNDGVILAEAALAEIPVLVTSDNHLLNIEMAELKVVFDEQDLFQVHPMHPKGLLPKTR
jgi:predicted nucleic acid-binding protein